MPLHTDLGMIELNPVLSRGEIRIVVEILVVGTGARSDACGLKGIDDALAPGKVSGKRYNDRVMATVDR